MVQGIQVEILEPIPRNNAESVRGTQGLPRQVQEGIKETLVQVAVHDGPKRVLHDLGEVQGGCKQRSQSGILCLQQRPRLRRWLSLHGSAGMHGRQLALHDGHLTQRGENLRYQASFQDQEQVHFRGLNQTLSDLVESREPLSKAA